MSQHDGEYDEMVGRILHAAADLAEPADDGLDRIRARLATSRVMLSARDHALLKT